MTLDLVSESRCFGGRQLTYRHASKACACDMRFACYLPPAAERGPVPALYWLSGLTCTEENFSVKSGAQRYAAELGIALIIPDTSPRGVNLPGENDFMKISVGFTTQSAVASARSSAIVLGASSPSTMWSAVMTANAIATEMLCAVVAAMGAGRDVSDPRDACRQPAIPRLTRQ